LFDVILQGTDLSPVTDKLWKKFFEKQFGVDRTNEVIEIMSEKRVSFRWLQLYEVFLFTCFVSSF
jgi:elongin-A